jgi:antitoxin CptB
MKELDLLLLGYLEQYYPQASAGEQRVFADLLDLEEPQLYAYLLGRETPSDPAVADIVRKLRAAVHY